MKTWTRIWRSFLFFALMTVVMLGLILPMSPLYIGFLHRALAGIFHAVRPSPFDYLLSLLLGVSLLAVTGAGVFFYFLPRVDRKDGKILILGLLIAVLAFTGAYYSWNACGEMQEMLRQLASAGRESAGSKKLDQELGSWSAPVCIAAALKMGIQTRELNEAAAREGAAFEATKNAAAAGDTTAQNKLGLSYRDGLGGADPDAQEAYFWFSLSGNAVLRDAVAKSLTPGQKAAADERVKEWKPLAVPTPVQPPTPADTPVPPAPSAK